MAHIPNIEPRPKMDTPTGLCRGVCSCTWKSESYGSSSDAWRSANAHADALNKRGCDTDANKVG